MVRMKVFSPMFITQAGQINATSFYRAKNMVKLIRMADKLKDDYQFAIMLVHPTGHAHQDRARGSTAFKGALDTEIIVNRLGDHD